VIPPSTLTEFTVSELFVMEAEGTRSWSPNSISEPRLSRPQSEIHKLTLNEWEG